MNHAIRIERSGGAAGALRAGVGWALPTQVVWAILAAAWNLAGVYLIAQGARAPGPAASIGTGVTMLAFAVAFVVTISRWPMVYVLLSMLAGLASIAAAGNAFIADPALWLSAFWRYAGAALNAIGFIAAAHAVVACFKWTSSR